jgi:hypothetical protein
MSVQCSSTKVRQAALESGPNRTPQPAGMSRFPGHGDYYSSAFEGATKTVPYIVV